MADGVSLGVLGHTVSIIKRAHYGLKRLTIGKCGYLGLTESKLELTEVNRAAH